MLEYTAELPWDISLDDVERLRGLGEVKLAIVIEGLDRRTVIRELSDEMVGWRYDLGNRDWWQDNLSRGGSVP